MAKARVLIPSKSEALENGTAGWMPELAIYHVTSRVVHRQLLFSPDAKEEFRKFMRMYERFSGCRVLSYCVMTNHFHILLEVPEMPAGGECVNGVDLGISEEELLRRLGGLYSQTTIKAVEQEIADARQFITRKHEGFERLAREDKDKNRALGERTLQDIFERYTKRMHNLSLFMKGLLQRFTRWFNRENGLRGTLWEERFHSVIVESGTACRMMAAYIDLNPVRAGICTEPEDYRWSSYGEAIGAGRGSSKARSGLVRALHGHEGREGTARGWAQGGVAKEYRQILVSEGTEGSEERMSIKGARQRVVTRKGKTRASAEAELEKLNEDSTRDLKIAKIVRCRVRYFKDGAILGSRSFVDGIFALRRKQFGEKRKTGARKPRGALAELAGEIWSLRDLQQ
jgi:putative transposase